MTMPRETWIQNPSHPWSFLNGHRQLAVSQCNLLHSLGQSSLYLTELLCFPFLSKQGQGIMCFWDYRLLLWMQNIKASAAAMELPHGSFLNAPSIGCIIFFSLFHQRGSVEELLLKSVITRVWPWACAGLFPKDCSRAGWGKSISRTGRGELEYNAMWIIFKTLQFGYQCREKSS